MYIGIFPRGINQIFSPAILVYVFYNCCQPGCSRLLHLLFISLGAACVTIGTLSAVELDTITASHLVTMHAWCGAAAIFLTAFQVLGIFCVNSDI